MWYYISAAPAVSGITFELMRDRVDLYEPTARREEDVELFTGKGKERQSIPYR